MEIDYYPFGMDMPQRRFGNDNRYGFNGKERDKDIHSLTAYDYGFRIYNPAIGKFLSVDPLTQEYPELTPYQYASNNPIKFIDLDGLEGTVKDMIKDRPQIDMCNAPSSSPLNAQGVPRNAKFFWGELLTNHPEYFSDANANLINKGYSPFVDEIWTKSFSSDVDYMGNKLIHHHLNGERMAIGIPEKMHWDHFSELHSYLKKLPAKLRGQSMSNLTGNLFMAIDIANSVTAFATDNPEAWINMFSDLTSPEENVGRIRRTRPLGEDYKDAYFTINKVIITTTTISDKVTKEVLDKYVSEREIYATIYSDYIWNDETKKYIGVNKVYTQEEFLNYDKKGRITGGTIWRSWEPNIIYELGKGGKVIGASEYY